MLPIGRAVSIILFSIYLPLLSAERLETSSEVAQEAAKSYRQLFEEIEASKEDLGERYDAILEPGEHPDVVVTEADRDMFEKQLAAQLAQLSELAQQPEVDWGIQEEIREKGPTASIPQFKPMRSLVKGAIWQAENHWDEGPDKAINHLMDAMSLVRQQNQETYLLSHLIQNACDNLVYDAIGELAPKMSKAQREALLPRMNNLPASGTLAGAFAAERDHVSGWFRQKIYEELDIWESEHGGAHGYRFPEDLRLAGIVLLPNKPARISLHNTRKGNTFWLEQGQAIDDILLEKVDRKTSSAWIRLGKESAVIDLGQSTIKSHYVPLEVLQKVMMQCGYASGEETEVEMLEKLKKLGITPDTVLEQLDTMHAHYSEAIRRLGDTVEEFKEWEDATFDSYEKEYGKDSFYADIIPHLFHIVETDHGFRRKRESLEYAFATMNESPTDSIASSENFGYAETKNGFAITPVEYIEHEHQDRYTVHIGKLPENED